ncbi:unnamed protein product [Arctogadus glacialis]
MGSIKALSPSPCSGRQEGSSLFRVSGQVMKTTPPHTHAHHPGGCRVTPHCSAAEEFIGRPPGGGQVKEPL